MGGFAISLTITRFSDQSHDSIGVSVAGCDTASAAERTSCEVFLEERERCLREVPANSLGFGLPILVTERRVNCRVVI